MPDFAIHALAVGGGTAALSPMPRTGDDLAQIVAWGADAVLSMTPNDEMAALGAERLSDRLAAAGIEWLHMPIADFGAPQGKGADQWPDIAAKVNAILTGGGKVLIHCRGGCGRSGMACLRLMVEAGEWPDVALARLRAVRPCAVETEAQLAWATTPG